MEAKLLQSTVLWTFLSVAVPCLVGCSDDEDYRDVDGQSTNLLNLTSDHIRYIDRL